MWNLFNGRKLRTAMQKIAVYKRFTKKQGAELRIAHNKVALAHARIVELRGELDGLRADMADVLDKVHAINQTHRLIPREIAPKFQARAKMFELRNQDGLRDG